MESIICYCCNNRLWIEAYSEEGEVSIAVKNGASQLETHVSLDRSDAEILVNQLKEMFKL